MFKRIGNIKMIIKSVLEVLKAQNKVYFKAKIKIFCIFCFFFNVFLFCDILKEVFEKEIKTKVIIGTESTISRKIHQTTNDKQDLEFNKN